MQLVQQVSPALSRPMLVQDCKDIPAVQKMLATAKEVLGYDLLKLCLEGPKDKLDDTVYSQPALFVAGAPPCSTSTNTFMDQATLSCKYFNISNNYLHPKRATSPYVWILAGSCHGVLTMHKMGCRAGSCGEAARGGPEAGGQLQRGCRAEPGRVLRARLCRRPQL